MNSESNYYVPIIFKNHCVRERNKMSHKAHTWQCVLLPVVESTEVAYFEASSKKGSDIGYSADALPILDTLHIEVHRQLY